ncbi:MAG: hypothetical protein SO542_08545 [Muribaculaceae bacterium]|nr:hypothetical protein [Muribaculaceae bacterium]
MVNSTRAAVIFNAIIIPLLIPLALRGVKYKPIGASALLRPRPTRPKAKPHGWNNV